MSQKKDKKFRKEVKRQVNSNFGEGMKALSNIIRKRPQWVPKKVWVVLYMPLFEKKYWGIILRYID